MYKTTTMEQLCAHFHVGYERLRELMKEHGMTDRPRAVRKAPSGVSPSADGATPRRPLREAKPRCANCKRFSGSGAAVQDGWCMKFRKRVRKSGWCSEHQPPQDGDFVRVCLPTR